ASASGSATRTSSARPVSTRSSPSSMIRAMRRAAGPTKTRSLKPRRLARREPGAAGLEVTFSAYLRQRVRHSPGLARAVQRHHAEGQVAVGDIRPARLADPGCEPLLVWPVADRLVEVVVRLAVRARDAGHARQHLSV